MRKIREVLRLRREYGRSLDDIAASCGMARSTVGDYLRRAEVAKLSWPLADAMVCDEALEALLFPRIDSAQRVVPQPDWAPIHREMGRKGVTLQLLWQEYKEAHPSGYQYSRFADLYGQWRGKVDLVFRNQHAPGERLFIDYAGHTIKVFDALSNGVVREAQIFVATWGASNYTYAEATWTQSKADFIGSHVRAFDFFGVAPSILVPDNLKSAVTKPCRYDPDINQAYYAMASHYGSAVIPARPYRPRDKAKVENAVLVVERWILAALRNRRFFGLDELNAEVKRLLARLNARRFRKIDGTRSSLFAEVDLPAARPLPAVPFEVRDIKLARVHIDYHVELDRHYYSVPYQLVQKQIELHYSATLVEIFHRGQRVASHSRGYKVGGYATLSEHMPESHRQYAKWTPERLVAWAKDDAGPAAAQVANMIMLSKRHPQIGFKSVLGLIDLGRRYGATRLEQACERALSIKSPNYQTVKSTLRCGLDRQTVTTDAAAPLVAVHENIRGAAYYQ